MTVQFNRISGGYFGVDAGPTTSTTVNDVTIFGNKFVGPFGEDAIRLNRYHDGPDADPYGLLIEGNEITGRPRERQPLRLPADGLGRRPPLFRRNYLHDNRCQGFFIKDQAVAVPRLVIEDNLLLRNAAPCDDAARLRSAVDLPDLRAITNHVFRPTTRSGTTPRAARRRGAGRGLQGRPDRPQRDLARGVRHLSTFGGYTASQQHRRASGSGWPAAGVQLVAQLLAAVRQPGGGRLPPGNGLGVDWAPADQQYGPESAAEPRLT